QAGSERVVAVFQPHGYGPARFLRPELRLLLPALMRPVDRFCYSEIFYAGGTVARDISSQALAADLPPAMSCAYAADHGAARRWAVAEARPGDTILVMGARDPDLPRLARSIYGTLEGAGGATPSRLGVAGSEVTLYRAAGRASGDRVLPPPMPSSIRSIM